MTQSSSNRGTRHGGLTLAMLLVLGTLTACGDGPQGADPEPLWMVVVTFNTGTSEGLGHDTLPDDGYSEAHALMSDTYYGDGLAWTPAVVKTTEFFAQLQPDVVVFQEIFYTGECAAIPEASRIDFICDNWEPGFPTVAQLVLGEGYQVMCHPGKNDKCAAVKGSFGSFRGCQSDFCLEGMTGFDVDGCGNGARVTRALIDLNVGGTLTLVNYHGSSGFEADDMDCRKKQVDQVFVDLGDGEPGANGARNLIMGDFNTDPGIMVSGDPSAARWLDFAGAPGDGSDFTFLTPHGPGIPGSYQNLLNIDHVVSDVATGDCWVGGLTPGHPAVIDAIYFDHRPIVCELEMPRSP